MTNKRYLSKSSLIRLHSYFTHNYDDNIFITEGWFSVPEATSDTSYFFNVIQVLVFVMCQLTTHTVTLFILIAF